MAARGVFLDQRALRQLRVHTLPSPKLFALADQVQAQGVYADSPRDGPSRIATPPASPTPQRTHLRRRSTAFRIDTVFVLPTPGEEKARDTSERQAVLEQYHWPLSPRLQDAFIQAGVERGELPSVVRTLMNDMTAAGWWQMMVPSLLFAVQNNLMYVFDLLLVYHGSTDN